jgi:hypothetical protein
MAMFFVQVARLFVSVRPAAGLLVFCQVFAVADVPVFVLYSSEPGAMSPRSTGWRGGRIRTCVGYAGDFTGRA